MGAPLFKVRKLVEINSQGDLRNLGHRLDVLATQFGNSGSCEI